MKWAEMLLGNNGSKKGIIYKKVTISEYTVIFTQKSGHPVKLHSLSFQTQQESNNSTRNVFWYGYKIFRCIQTHSLGLPAWSGNRERGQPLTRDKH